MTWTEWVEWRRDPVRVAELDKQAEVDLAEYIKATGGIIDE